MLTAEQAMRLCDRNFGIGGDGVRAMPRLPLACCNLRQMLMCWSRHCWTCHGTSAGHCCPNQSHADRAMWAHTEACALLCREHRPFCAAVVSVPLRRGAATLAGSPSLREHESRRRPGASDSTVVRRAFSGDLRAAGAGGHGLQHAHLQQRRQRAGDVRQRHPVPGALRGGA